MRSPRPCSPSCSSASSRGSSARPHFWRRGGPRRRGRDGRDRALGPPQRCAEVILRVEQRGGERNGALEALDRVVGVALQVRARIPVGRRRARPTERGRGPRGTGPRRRRSPCGARARGPRSSAPRAATDPGRNAASIRRSASSSRPASSRRAASATSAAAPRGEAGAGWRLCASVRADGEHRDEERDRTKRHGRILPRRHQASIGSAARAEARHAPRPAPLPRRGARAPRSRPPRWRRWRPASAARRRAVTRAS